MKQIHVVERAGSFAENKDVARDLRNKVIKPTIEDGKSITIDSEGVDLATQSFIHALLSEVIRMNSGDALDLIEFRGCNGTVRNLIEIVSTYSQDTVEED